MYHPPTSRFVIVSARCFTVTGDVGCELQLHGSFVRSRMMRIDGAGMSRNDHITLIALQSVRRVTSSDVGPG